MAPENDSLVDPCEPSVERPGSALVGKRGAFGACACATGICTFGVLIVGDGATVRSGRTERIDLGARC